MANDNTNFTTEESAGSKIISGVIVVVIIAIWLAVMIVLVKLDVGGFGSDVLRPILKNVPVVNLILPPADEEEVIQESDLPYTTLKQALDRIDELELLLETAKKELEEALAALDDKDKEIARLKTFEDNQELFELQKEEFYNEIVYNENAPDADTYIEWYEALDPEHAERIYRQVIAAENEDSSFKELADTYAAMKPKDAATILETMTNDLDTVAAILSAMDAEARGAIMGQMSAEFAANVTKKMSP